MSEEQRRSARVELLSIDKKRPQPIRSASQHSPRLTTAVYCTDCKLPLLTEIDTRETLNKSRAASTCQNEQLCRECTSDKSKNTRTSPSRLVKSASINWSNVGDNIETWFEKAKTPDQRVVYNFLQEINNKPIEKPTDKPPAKDLDDVLNNLKKYQTRLNSPRPRSKFTRLFESSSWRVMRHPIKSHQVSCVNQQTNDSYTESIFVPTNRKLRSTFLIHPNWI